MALRNASGKFSLSAFGRNKNQAQSQPGEGGVPPLPTNTYAPQPQVNTSSIYSGSGDDSIVSPQRDGSVHSCGGGGGGGGRSGGAALDGIGRKIGKSIAHTRLLPALGNQDLRLLQDLISSEKSVLTSAERLAVDMQTAASRLPVYGQQEGPDLQDVLSHSSTLLSQLSIAMRTFAQHEAAMRTCFKRIREREERLDELRSRRRTVGQKAEAAERKLAKMGPENKQLVQQTELLEQLRNSMRVMDSDIVNDEAKNGDFKRQAIKEAMSFKFGGLEELGEKMCIIGELGKLLLEEIPLEETPPGYSRAPYTSHDRTENTVSEAVKCLATVQFQAGSAAPKPPGLPPLNDGGSLRAPSLPRHNSHTIQAHEEFEQLPGNPQSPPGHGAPQLPPVELAYAGMEQSPPMDQPRKFSAVSAEIIPPQSSVVWNAPADGEFAHHDYEYEQQRQMDAERAGSTASPPRTELPVPPPALPLPEPGWQPLKANDTSGGTALYDGPPRTILRDGPVESPALALNNDAFTPLGESFMNPNDLQPPRRPSSSSGYYTPREGHQSPANEDVPVVNIPADYHNTEEATPTQGTNNLPTLPPHLLLDAGPRRPSSGYVAPASPPRGAHFGETEEFQSPTLEQHDTFYSNYYNNPRVSSSTFNVPRDVRASGHTFLSNASVPESINSDATHQRDSCTTYSSRDPRDSYATFHTRHSSDGEDAIVVTIPDEPMRSSTPTMMKTNNTNGATPRPETPTQAPRLGSGPPLESPPPSGPTISAAAFRRGQRRRSVSIDDMDNVASAHGHTDVEGGGARRLPSLAPSTLDVFGVQGLKDAPPSYTSENGHGNSLR